MVGSQQMLSTLTTGGNIGLSTGQVQQGLPEEAVTGSRRVPFSGNREGAGR